MENTVSNISSLKQAQREQASAISGQGMDRQVTRKISAGRKFLYGTAALVAILFSAWLVTTLLAGRSLSVDSGRVAVSRVTVGIFEDFIPTRGRLVPRSTVYLDAVEGGRVEQVLVEDGAMVRAGDPIVRLSNTNLQLEVLGREAAVTEQLNFMRTLELQLEQNRLAHKRNLVEIDYQITRLERSIERQRNLAEKALVSQSTLDELQDELTYYRNRREVTLESQSTDARLQEEQLLQLRTASTQLETSLALARNNLADLNVRAPVDGKLSGFDVEIGESIERGGRLGQIDDPDAYKLNARIDEFYLGRVDIGQVASASHNGQDLRLQVAKIYPQVKDGQFEVDMTFEEQPVGLRRGQTLQLRLTLGDNADAILIPNGSFYQETGGNWVFVVAPDESEAVKRRVRLGRRNSDFIEVLDGLEPGEKVITSPYTSYNGMDRLVLNED
jgi:HlyD family secretion protein